MWGEPGDIPRPFLIQLSRVVPFPNTPLAQMKCETPPLPHHVREFWNLMYLLKRSGGDTENDGT